MDDKEPINWDFKACAFQTEGMVSKSITDYLIENGVPFTLLH